VDKDSRKDFDELLDQCKGYMRQHGIEVYLVNFVNKQQILEIYEKRIGRMHDGWPLIHQEANGHAASIMALLRFVREERPRLDNWNVLLEAKVASHMNGFRCKIKAEVDKREDVRNTLRSLLVHT
jgi:hypothetical protein